MNLKHIKIFNFKTISYKTYLHLAEYFRKKRCENVLFCDHYPVITAGIQYKQESFKFHTDIISQQGVEIYYVKRGGDLTAHELGQIIIYPHIDIKKRKIFLTNFVQTIIDITKDLIESEFRVPLIYKNDMPGLYTKNNDKVASIGIEIRKGFTSSGIAINYSNNLKTFDYIFPCGYKNLQMNSIRNILTEQGNKIDDDEWNSKKIDFCKKWAERFLESLL